MIAARVSIPNVAAALFAAAALCIPFLVAAAEGDGGSQGEAVYLDHKCNICHAVSGAGIEAKSKKPSRDLSGFVTDDLEALARFLRKEEESEGADHKKAFGGTDEELQVIVDWLGSFEPPS